MAASNIAPVPVKRERLPDGRIRETMNNGTTRTFDPNASVAGGVKDFIGDIPIVGDALGLNDDDPNAVNLGVEEEFAAPKASAAEAYGAAAEDRARALNWGGSDPIRESRDVRVDDLGYHDVSAPREGEATKLGDVERYQAGQIASPEDVTVDGEVERIGAADIGPGERVGRVGVGRSVIDTTKGDEIRGMQEGALADLADRAAGRKPLAAAERFGAAMAEIGEQAHGLAGQARGDERAGARLQALQMIGSQGFKAAKESAAAAAEERAGAERALVGALSDVRGADVAQATRAAEMEQAANNLQAEIDRAIAQGNQAEANRLSIRQAELRQGAAEFNASAGNRRTEFATGVREGNVGRRLTRDTNQANLDSEASRFGAAAANLRGENWAGRADDMTTRNIDRETNVRVGNADRRTDIDRSGAQLRLTADQGNADRRLTRDTAESGRQTRDFGEREGAAGASTGRQIAGAGQQTNVAGEVVGGRAREEEIRRGIRNDNTSRQYGAIGAITEGAAAAGFGKPPAAGSDERIKRGIKPVVGRVPLTAAQKLAQAVEPVTFEYRPGEGPPGRHTGVLAQDLERDPVGRRFVSRDDEGVRQVDYGEMAAMLLQALRSQKARERGKR
ncbi:MAG TPA: tail fiber domain-containing protein [Methylomirabilota bacterium]|nr:tail fiber domain-containing protein [Methylomirabilota bacterium]